MPTPLDRQITVPRTIQAQVAGCGGSALLFLVKVDWPELKLTHAQALANNLASHHGEPPPYPDPQIITIRLEV